MGNSYLLTFLLFFVFTSNLSLYAQKNNNTQSLTDMQFLSYGKIPTWTGVASNWQTSTPTINLYDTKRYKGHSTYVMSVLKGCKNFSEFKNLVSTPERRQYVPFFLYDLRTVPISIKNNSYNWAIWVEDYNFTDTDAQITELLLRLAQLIPPKVPGFNNKGIILLATNATTKLHQRLSPKLLANGYATLTIEEMRQKTGSRKQQVLNAGTVTGKLIVVNNNQEAQKLLPTDIAVYNYVPLEVPPVAGIITLHPQTPLSHTAILAKNRKTVNVYVPSLSSINGADKYVGKTVTLRAYGREISMYIANTNLPNTQTTPTQVPLQLPTASKALGYKVWAFDKTAESLLTIENIGTKAANYARLQRLLGDAFVRKGYAVGYQPYFEVVAQQAQPYIDQLLQQKKQLSKPDINRYLQNIQQCIKESKVPPQTIQAIRQLIQNQYPYSRIRLRSSTNCEDLPQFNGAGLYDSEGVDAWQSNKKLSKAILNVYASLWNSRAFWERDYFNINQQQAAMALHINEAFDDDNELANGVILTEPTAKSIKILVNIQADDVLVTNPTTANETPESFYIDPKLKQIVAINSYSSRQNILLNYRSRQYLVEQLADISTKTHAYFTQNKKDYGVDMEFKIVCNNDGTLQLFIKQARLLQVANL